ncbi:MAG: phenylacetate-CoA oxygenase subunit PaaJ [Cryomorphaceae bacterium]|nr:phenylacetate-CoA oxygenase subunit PaaJ [Cryomorphaceae bacterium]
MMKEKIRTILHEVKDPEIPVLSIEDLGIVRDFFIDDTNTVTVVITPTYSGCPAMDTIEADIIKALEEAGFKAKVKTVLDPPWTTDWMSEEGKRRLEEYGIAAPVKGSADKRTLFGKSPDVRCPHCRSMDTQLVSQFGSTACKALYKCIDCLEPFDYFKCI